MSLTKPFINTMGAFSASESKRITVNVLGGDAINYYRVFVYSANDSLNNGMPIFTSPLITVTNDIANTSIRSFSDVIIPSGTLTNNNSYQILAVTTEIVDGVEYSVEGNATLITCYEQPNVLAQYSTVSGSSVVYENLADGITVSSISPSIKIQFSNSNLNSIAQPNTATITLYGKPRNKTYKTLITQKEVYDFVYNSTSHIYSLTTNLDGFSINKNNASSSSGLSDERIYDYFIIDISLRTIENMVIHQTFSNINCYYSSIPHSPNLYVQNLCQKGVVQITCSGYKSLNPINQGISFVPAINPTSADITGVDAYALWNNLFNVNQNFTLRIWGKDFQEGTILQTTNNSGTSEIKINFNIENIDSFTRTTSSGLNITTFIENDFKDMLPPLQNGDSFTFSRNSILTEDYLWILNNEVVDIREYGITTNTPTSSSTITITFNRTQKMYISILSAGGLNEKDCPYYLESVRLPYSYNNTDLFVGIQWTDGLFDIDFEQVTPAISAGLYTTAEHTTLATLPNGNEGSWENIISGDYLRVNSGVLTHGDALSYKTLTGHLVLDTSVTNISTSTFLQFSYLQSVTIPNSVTIIGSSAFAGCTGLTSITIPNSVTNIGDSAFGNCSALTSIIIPSSVTSIGDDAFYYCSSLTTISIPSNVVNIGDGVFIGCSALTSIIVDPNNIVYDSRNNCNAIIETATNTLIFGCKNTTIPSTITSIGDNAFDGCSGLTSITIPNSVTSIGDYAFSGCSGLTSIIIPNGVISIGKEAFYRSSNLESISIPATLTTINLFAFQNCSNLSSVYITDLEKWCNIDFDGVLSNPLYPHNASLYINNTLASNLIIPNSVTNIRNNVFSGCSSLTSVTIPASVTSIGGYAFVGCSNLSEVVINNTGSVFIGSYAFGSSSTTKPYILTHTTSGVVLGTLNGQTTSGINGTYN